MSLEAGFLQPVPVWQGASRSGVIPRRLWVYLFFGGRVAIFPAMYYDEFHKTVDLPVE